LQIIDYREPTVDAGIQLVTAVHALRGKPVPLPDPLPEEPPVPFGYITRLGNTLAEKELSPQQQTQLLVELRQGLDEDGDDPSARSDIAQLLRMLRLRHDVTYRTRSEIDNVLASIEATETAAATTPAAARPQPTTAVAEGSTQPSAQPAGGPQRSSTDTGIRPAVGSGAANQSAPNKRLIIIGAAALAVIAVIAVVVVLATQGGNSKQTPKATGNLTNGNATNGNGTNGNATNGNGTTGNATKLDSFLLVPADVASIMNDPNMQPYGAKEEQLRTPAGTLSNLDCLGPFEPIENAVYQGASGFTAARGQAIQTVGEDPAHRTYQAVAAFSSPDQARAFVQASADKWKACAGQTVTMTTPRKTFEWTFGQFMGSPPKIWMEKTRTDGRTCHHVLSAVSDVVVDVLACAAANVNSPAGKIADQIAAKIPQ
jgi:serine/threonine kinase PknH